MGPAHIGVPKGDIKDVGKSFKQPVHEKYISYRPENISVQIISAELRDDCWNILSEFFFLEGI